MTIPLFTKSQQLFSPSHGYPTATQFSSHPALALYFQLRCRLMEDDPTGRWIRLCSVRAGRWWGRSVVKQEEEFIVT